jgi:isoleucyl-tRNA synthetase
MELRRLPKRTYTDSLDVWFDSDSEPATSERQRKKPRNHYKSLVEETQ